jgi:multicomponent K+:H+ antiporter subunit E
MFVQRLLPTPLLSAALLALWLALAREVTLGQVLLGLTLGIVVPIATAKLRPTPVRVRRPLTVARFILRVGHDVLLSNFLVAWGVVTWSWRPSHARFVVIPLELRDPYGLAALAMVTTVVPGTVWSEIALDRSAVMLHVWDVDDEAAFVGRYKARYEKPLQEIFE